MKSKRAGKPAFFIVFALILALTYATFFGIENYYGDTRNVYVKGANDIRWGIDISGGVEAVFSPDKADVDITDEDMDAAKSIIETRLVNNNITDYEVYSDSDNHQIIVRFPWAAGESDFDAASAVQELGETALLTFCRNEDSEDVILSGAEDIEKAEAGMDQDGNYVVYLYFTDAGTSKFSAATAELVGSTISIWMDDTMLQAPTVNEAITTGEAYITGMADADAAKSLADKINAGSLPFALTVDNSKLQVISATLGSDALEVMLIAGAVAFGLVCLLMILRYRLNGVVAAIALLGQLFPVNKTTIIFLKTRCHNIREQFCLRSMDVFVHFRLALFFKISLAGRKPNKDGFRERLYVLVHKVGKNNGFATASRAFEDNITCRLVHSLK